ncbi:TolC family protein [Niallia endozanthoxylica]|uniref:Uncharacterized protein n=1 Tax=Niallia endozanthoxylica TaxID=2036016 RepID=A0A5J5H6F4_9BACI|nr:TolC family protein [Niallia endozanthoxylica]KAA9015508.1 hypothetical protein F4V44_22910 [Niallia endozanthoxylica]
MKKLAFMVAAGLALSSLQPTVYAYAADQQQEESAEVKKLSALSIDDVIERGLERNSMLLLLEYQMQVMDNQQKDMEKDIQDLDDDIDEANSSVPKINLADINEKITGLHEVLAEIEKQISDLETGSEADEQDEKDSVDETDEKDSIDDLVKQSTLLQLKLQKLETSIAVSQLEQTKSGYIQAMQAINAQVEALEDAIDQLQLALKKLEVGELQLTFETKEAQQMVKMMLTSSYTALLSSKQQIDLMEASVAQTEKNVNVLEKKVEFGISSAYELEQNKRELEKQKTSLNWAKKDYQRDLAKLLLDIDVEYNPDIQLKDIENSSIVVSVKEKDINKLIENSYSYKKAQQNLSLAELDLDDLVSQEDASVYKIKQAEIAVEVEKENIRQLKLDLKESIKTLNYDLEKASQNLVDKKRDLEYAKRDSEQYKLQFEAGLLSEHQYQQSNLSVKQAEFDIEMAELGYYMLKEQVKAVHQGVIQTQ